jgi:hypothetical protein
VTHLLKVTLCHEQLPRENYLHCLERQLRSTRHFHSAPLRSVQWAGFAQRWRVDACGGSDALFYGLFVTAPRMEILGWQTRVWRPRSDIAEAKLGKAKP